MRHTNRPLLALLLLVPSCSAHPPTVHSNNRSAPLAGADATTVAASGETAFAVAVTATGAALDSAAALDYSLHITCNATAAGAAISRDFTKAALDAGTATLPKLAEQCTGYLTQLKVTPSGNAVSWTFAPPANPAGLNLTYTATNATAAVASTKALPTPLSATASDNTMAFTFAITANAAQTTSTDLGVTAAQIAASATVQGTTPPLFSIAAASAAFSGTVCSANIVAICSNGATSDVTGLTSCSGVDLAHLKIYTDATLVAASSVKPNLPALDRLSFPLTIANCTPSAAGLYTTTVAVKFVNDTGDGAQNSSLTIPLKLTIKFNPNP